MTRSWSARGLLVCSTLLFQHAASGQSGSWDIGRSLLRPRAALEAQAAGGTVYAIGGGGCGAASPMEALADGEWAPRSSPWARERAEFTSAVVDDRLYVFGGGDCISFFGDAFVYDPSRGDSWSPVTPMPAPRSYTPAAAAVDGKIYLFGGGTNPSDGNAGSHEVWMYDPALDSWRRMADMPTPRIRARAAAIDGRIYVAGGQTGSGTPLRTLEAYDPSTNTWNQSPLAPMSSARVQPATGAMGGLLYVFGGTDFRSIFSSGEVYDPAADEWSTAPAMPAPRVASGSAVAGNVLYVLGGVGSSTVSTTFTFTAPGEPEDDTAPVVSVPGDMAVDATSPAGAVVDFEVSASDPDDPAGPVTCDPGAGSTFPIGTTTVSCQSTDAHGNTGVASFTIAVRGASQQINVLAASLAGIGGGSFARQLSSVQQAFSSGRTTAACGALNAFMNHVRAQSGKQVTTAQADQALAAARRVAAVMGC